LQEPVDEKTGKSGGVLGCFHSVDEFDTLKEKAKQER